MEPFGRFGTISYSHSIATMAVSLAVSTQHTNVTDARRTDTVRRHRPRYA